MIADPIVFLNFEEKQKMFGKSIFGIYYWPLIRAEVFDYVYDILLAHDERHPDLKNNKKPRLENALKLLKYTLIKPHSFAEGTGKVWLSMSCKNEYDQAYLLVKTFPEDIFYINRPVNYSHIINTDKKKTMYPDGVEILRGIWVTVNRFNPYVKLKIKRELDTWVKTLEKEYGISLDIQKLISIVIHAVFSMKVLEPYFERRIKKNPPRTIVVGPYYEKFNFALLMAAKQNRIKVIEMQHGEISKFHIAYNYLSIHEDFIPDSFLLYGEYWKNTIRFPDKERLVVCGSVGLENRIKNYNCGKVHKDLQVLFISQGPYSKALYPLAVELAELIEKKGLNLKICYKLHPSEVNTWKELHPSFSDSRVELKVNDLYDCMELSDFQVGIDSTALYEGLAFGLKTFIYDCPFLAAGEMKRFCEQGYGTLFSTPEELVKGLLESKELLCSVDYFWEKEPIKKIRNELELK